MNCLRWAQRALPGQLASEAKVAVDGTRVVAMGHSAGATLALHVGAVQPQPVLAVLDLYGPKLFRNEFWKQPLAAFAQVPKLPEDFLHQVYEGPVPTSSPPMFKDGKPDLSSPRNAWMISTLRDGTNIDKVIKDGDYTRADPVESFHKAYPPTRFVHGTADIFAPKMVSGIATMKLRKLGVDADRTWVEGAAHVFDFQLEEDDPLFQGPVLENLRWLAAKAGL